VGLRITTKTAQKLDREISWVGERTSSKLKNRISRIHKYLKETGKTAF